MASYPATSAGLVYIGPASFSVPGDQTGIYRANRALRATSSSGGIVTGIYVLFAAYAEGKTVVVTRGASVPASLAVVQLGQDPDNAPFSPSPLLAAAFM